MRLSFILFVSTIGFVSANPPAFVNQALGVASSYLDGPRAQSKWSWESCGEDSDPIVINEIQVSPDPPEVGEDLTVTVTGTANEPIQEGAFADVAVKLGLIKLLSKTFDLCEEARKANMTVQCPVEEGTYTVTQTVALPKEIPRVKFKIEVEGYTVDEDPLMCLELSVNFMLF